MITNFMYTWRKLENVNSIIILPSSHLLDMIKLSLFFCIFSLINERKCCRIRKIKNDIQHIEVISLIIAKLN